MTLKIYVSQDNEGRDWAPDTPHEVEACEWMLKKAWMDFNHLHELYAILVNLRDPSADMLVMRERGIGVLELKHVFGELWIDPDGPWTVDSRPIHAGVHKNPREQVRSYAQKIRPKVIDYILPEYLPKTDEQRNKLKFQTGVCFTNPNINLQRAQKYLNGHRPDCEPWEEFSIFGMNFSTAWIRELRFRLSHDSSRRYVPVRLDPGLIVKIATEDLGCVLWEEMHLAMPPGNSYGYLILEDAQEKKVFNLVEDHTVVGRSHECDIALPERFGRVSKRHCAIQRSLEGIQIVDLESKNGTYLKGRRIKILNPIMDGDTIILGGPSAGEKACALRYEANNKEYQTGATEFG